MTNISALTRAVELAGSQCKLAALTGYSQNAIWHAVQRARPSAEMAIKIERALAGAVTAAELRPDLFAIQRA